MAKKKWLVRNYQIIQAVFSFVIFGLGFVIIFVSFSWKWFAAEYTQNIKSLAWSSIVAGITVSIVALLGIIVIIWPKKVFLIIYAAFLLIMGLGAIVFGIFFMMSMRSSVKSSENDIEKHIVFLISVYTESKHARDVMDNMQTHFECCGVNKHTDWLARFEYPTSCCEPKYVASDLCPQRFVHKDGCYILVRESIGSYGTWITAVIFISGILLLIDGVFVLYVSFHTKA